ncbi:hypothetical protein [Streptomyces caatingaensis]|uniref:Uncharacterized protein n=1 Tax=Streptomyces caatingaensis TaxID=1678637 RepID=A0A0K9XDJ6_9ACTN|nr:hypothetical protein [Streptomyces caatingaensis]KNB51509.1 hypothetical protein AC230_14075 [Streptomyces caatingaensis]
MAAAETTDDVHLAPRVKKTDHFGAAAARPVRAEEPVEARFHERPHDAPDGAGQDRGLTYEIVN